MNQKMKKRGFLSLALMLTLSVCFMGLPAGFAEVIAPAHKYVDFPDMQDKNWSSFAWGDADATAAVSKGLTYENSKNADKALKVTKTITTAGFTFASVYYNNFGEMATGLNADDMYGVRFYVYQQSAATGSGLGFKFGDNEQVNITCIDDGSDTVLTTRDLDFSGYRRYTVPFTADLDVAAVNQLQIMIWGAADAEIYLSNFEIIYTGELHDPNPPVEPEAPDMGSKSLMLSGFNDKASVDMWGVSGQSGTPYKTELSGETVKEGAGSLKYSWQNPLYSFGWTEAYLDVAEIVEHNKNNDLKGLTFWLNNTAEQTVGEVGFWIKAAEADGSEYEAHYDKIPTGTGLDFTGWRKIEVPFTAFTPDKLQSYSSDENGQFDADQMAFIKIGLWSNSANVVEVEIYLDDLQLTAGKELSFPVTGGEVSKEKGLEAWAWVLISLGALAVAGGITVTVIMIIKKKKGTPIKP